MSCSKSSTSGPPVRFLMTWMPTKESRWLIVCLFFLFAPSAQASGPTYTAHLQVKAEHDRLHITGYCTASDDSVVRYKLAVSKKGMSGNSETSQSGEVHLKKDQRQSVSRATITVSPTDTYAILLSICKNGTVVAEDFIQDSR